MPLRIFSCLSVLFSDDVAAQGGRLEQQHEQPADDEGNNAAHQAIYDPMGAGEPRCEGPYDLPQYQHLAEVDAQGALAQQRPPCGCSGMVLAVVAARGKVLYQQEQ